MLVQTVQREKGAKFKINSSGGLRSVHQKFQNGAHFINRVSQAGSPSLLSYMLVGNLKNGAKFKLPALLQGSARGGHLSAQELSSPLPTSRGHGGLLQVLAVMEAYYRYWWVLVMEAYYRYWRVLGMEAYYRYWRVLVIEAYYRYWRSCRPTTGTGGS
jgi:hypothetical protein